MTNSATKARLYVTEPLGSAGSIIPAKDQQHYLTTVMRVKDGDVIALFNGSDGEWHSQVEITGKRSCVLNITQQTRTQVPSPDVWLLFAPVKKARLDFIAQKASEMGASLIWPTRTDFCQVTRVNDDRLAANAIEAAEQTERLDIAEIRDFAPLHQVLDAVSDQRLLIWCDETSAGAVHRNAVTVFAAHEKPSSAAILIGPEGGFSEAEQRLLAAHKNCLKVSLGPRILRADTAAIAALTCYQSVFGDWA